MANPLISVIIPAYNVEKHLYAALASVFAQTFQDFECIVVDDGSTDDTPRTIERESRITAIRQTNQGASAARNAGIHAARGEYLTFLDADNLWYPARLEVQLAFHQAEPLLDFSHVQLIERIAEGVPPPAWALCQHPENGLTYPFAPSGLMIKRQVMLQLGGYDSRFRVGEITEWLSRARDAGLREARLSPILGEVWIHQNNVSHDQSTMRALVLRALHESIRRKRNVRTKTWGGGDDY